MRDMYALVSFHVFTIVVKFRSKSRSEMNHEFALKFALKLSSVYEVSLLAFRSEMNHVDLF